MRDLPGLGLRVLYAVESFPHLTQTYIITEIEAMRRFGVHVEVWSSKPPLAPYATDIPVHNGTFEDAIESAKPHLVHTHWTYMVRHFRDVVARAGLPLTVRGHHPSDFHQAINDALQSDTAVKGVYMYSRFANVLPEKYSKVLPVDACFNPDLYFPDKDKDPKLVLRVAPARTVKDLDFFMRVASRCPEHRFVLIAGTTAELACPEELKEYNRKLGEPVELYIDSSHDEISKLMRKAGIYLYTVRPSEEYSMPISVSEALGSGCYVINRMSEGAQLHLGGAGSLYENEDDAVRLIRETKDWNKERWDQERAKSLLHAQNLASPSVLRPVLDNWLKIAELNAGFVPYNQQNKATAQSEKYDTRQLVVVLGMHRSGTSAISRSLKVIGVDLGNNLIPAVEGNNDKGFWEDAEVNALNNEMLLALGTDWFQLSLITTDEVENLCEKGYLISAVALLQRKVEGVAVFGIKDPRMAKLLPFWQRVFAQCKLNVSYVIALRHPLSVVKSLAKRDGLHAIHSYLMWLEYTAASIKYSAGRKRMLVDFDRLMQAPEFEVNRIAKCLDLEVDIAELQIYQTEFLAADLRHTLYDLDDLLIDDDCPQLVKKMYSSLIEVAADKTSLDNPALQNITARCLEVFISPDKRAILANQVMILVDELATEKAASLKTLAERDEDIARMRVELDALYTSTSWKITRPIRKVKSILKGEREVDDKAYNQNKINYPIVSEVLPKLIWKDDTHLKINEIEFYLTFDTKELQTSNSKSNHFLLGKSKSMVMESSALESQKKVNKIFEMGILQGGSVVLYDQIFQPNKIVAIEYTQKPVDALTNYIKKYNKTEVVKPYYGINQADRSAMEKILSAEFPSRDIDLIIDDASHLYDETREAFNISFPYLKKNGLYVIEDWAWAHWSGDYWQKANSYFKDRKALSNLLIELFMLAASRPDIIKDILIERSVITIKRGYGQLPAGKFNISDHYLLRGKKFEAFL